MTERAACRWSSAPEVPDDEAGGPVGGSHSAAHLTRRVLVLELEAERLRAVGAAPLSRVHAAADAGAAERAGGGGGARDGALVGLHDPSGVGAAQAARGADHQVGVVGVGRA